MNEDMNGRNLWFLGLPAMLTTVAVLVAILLVSLTALAYATPSEETDENPNENQYGEELVERCNLASGKIIQVSPSEQSDNLVEDLSLCRTSENTAPGFPDPPTTGTTVGGTNGTSEGGTTSSPGGGTTTGGTTITSPPSTDGGVPETGGGTTVGNTDSPDVELTGPDAGTTSGNDSDGPGSGPSNPGNSPGEPIPPLEPGTPPGNEAPDDPGVEVGEPEAPANPNTPVVEVPAENPPTVTIVFNSPDQLETEVSVDVPEIVIEVMREEATQELSAGASRDIAVEEVAAIGTASGLPSSDASGVAGELVSDAAAQLPDTGGPAILLPAAAFLLGSGVLAYAVLRRRV